MPSTSSKPSCVVCGGAPYGTRYGPLTCLACLVFFRRVIVNKQNLRCNAQKRCEVSYLKKLSCRACRLRKCYEAGMKKDAIKYRDLTGPRKPKIPNFSGHRQCQKRRYFSLSFDGSGQLELYIRGQTHHRATAHDIAYTFNAGFERAKKWANQFEAYLKLSEDDRKLVMSEYGIAFLLIEQSFRTVDVTEEDEFWILENNTFLHYNCFLGNPARDFDETQANSHWDFVTSLLRLIAKPFRYLKIKEEECNSLKSLLLFTPSFPGQVKLPNAEIQSQQLFSQLLPGEERLGEILLLIGSIRCAVKMVYNQIQCSPLFDKNHFDTFVNDCLLT